MGSKKARFIDLTDEIENASKPWKCPVCRKTYRPPVMTYISPIDGRERCEKCASKGIPT
jgi:hypothetical protein